MLLWRPWYGPINTVNINNSLQMLAWRCSINNEWKIDFVVSNFCEDLHLQNDSFLFFFFNHAYQMEIRELCVYQKNSMGFELVGFFLYFAIRHQGLKGKKKHSNFSLKPLIWTKQKCLKAQEYFNSSMYWCCKEVSVLKSCVTNRGTRWRYSIWREYLQKIGLRYSINFILCAVDIFPCLLLGMVSGMLNEAQVN